MNLGRRVLTLVALLALGLGSTAVDNPARAADAPVAAPAYVGCTACPDTVLVTDVRIERFGTVTDGYPNIRVWITCEAPGKAEIDVTVEQHIAGTNATRWAGINPNGPWFDCSTTSTLLRPSWDGCGCPEGHTYVRGWAVVRVIDWSSFYGPYAGVWQRSILLRRS